MICCGDITICIFQDGGCATDGGDGGCAAILDLAKPEIAPSDTPTSKART